VQLYVLDDIELYIPVQQLVEEYHLLSLNTKKILMKIKEVVITSVDDCC
jgi:hypothetical protein